MPELVSLIVLPENPWGTLMGSTGFVNRFCILHFGLGAPASCRRVRTTKISTRRQDAGAPRPKCKFERTLDRVVVLDKVHEHANETGELDRPDVFTAADMDGGSG